MAGAGHLTMWDVDFWNVVAGRQEHTHSAGDSGLRIKIALYLFTKQGLKPQKHKNKDQGNHNPKNIETYTEQNFKNRQGTIAYLIKQKPKR